MVKIIINAIKQPFLGNPPRLRELNSYSYICEFKQILSLKNTGLILLLAILFIQTGGGLLIYKIQQSCVHSEMEQALNNEATGFQQLTLSLSDFQKGEINANEISFNGKMYDVKSIKISGDKVELLVINDTKEENIVENIKRSVNTNSEQNKKLPYHLVNLLNWFYIYPVSGNAFLLLEQRTSYLPFSENVFSFISEISSPPPKLV